MGINNKLLINITDEINTNNLKVWVTEHIACQVLTVACFPLLSPQGEGGGGRVTCMITPGETKAKSSYFLSKFLHGEVEGFQGSWMQF